MGYNQLHPDAKLSWMAIAKPLYVNMFKLGNAAYLSTWLMYKGWITLTVILTYIVILLVAEYKMGDNKIEDVVLVKSNAVRWSVYLFLLFSIVWFGVFNNTTFVYFQY